MSDSLRPHGLQHARPPLSTTKSYEPMDCSLLDSSIHWIFQARVLEWGTFAFSDVGWLIRYKGYFLVWSLVVMYWEDENQNGILVNTSDKGAKRMKDFSRRKGDEVI